MARRKKSIIHLIGGLLVGISLGFLVKLYITNLGSVVAEDSCIGSGVIVRRYSKPSSLVDLSPEEDIHSSNRTLVFVGVMTAEQYLTTRARAVRDTWGGELPGKFVLFSSQKSHAADVPLVALRGVDDSYPPQKKSFMMLLYMYENFGDKFEWFMRADDDVYVRGDKLESFLRSVDSRKPQFIGQAGRGNDDERGTLSLNSDENFCMGGPGVLISRETLRRVAPHVRYCLKHLYSTHEDVEIGRCVAKFAGISCTWSYDMQTILHHNSSGTAAYTARLKRREVHRAITLHPVKDYRHMYRLHSYFKNLRIHELRESTLELRRDIARLPPGYGEAFGEWPVYHAVLSAEQSLTRYRPHAVQDIINWDFIMRSIYSADNSNPKRKIETHVKEALDDVIREVMELINAPSKQRGRVIDFCEVLYGYWRLDPLHGADYVLDMLLTYRRYRGRKITASVRRHAYLQQSFTGIEIREVPMGERPPFDDPLLMEKMGLQQELNYRFQEDYKDYDDVGQQMAFIKLKKLNIPIKDAFETGLMKFNDNLPKSLQFRDDFKEYSVYRREIQFILPLSGRYEVFARFMKNYEDICLKTDEAVTLIIVLYTSGRNPKDYLNTMKLLQSFEGTYSKKVINTIPMGETAFSRGAALMRGLEECSRDDLVFFVDVDMTFNFETLRRIRLNTIQYTQVYFPIVFSEYDPDVINNVEYNKLKGDIKNLNRVVEKQVSMSLDETSNNEDVIPSAAVNLKYSKRIGDDFGYFRQYGFGILSAFKSDLENVGGIDTNIKGWGLEDVHLYETLVTTNLTVFRTADDSLVHVFHNVDCDKNLEESQYNMCLGTMASTYGSLRQMYYYMLNNPNVLWPNEAKKDIS